MTAPTPKPGIMDLVAYKPGKSNTQSGAQSAQKVHKLSSNESGLGPSPKAIEAYKEQAAHLHIYPNPSSAPLRNALAAKYGLEADNVICGAGSDEILQLLCNAYIAPGDAIVQSLHGFSVYKIAAESNGGVAIYADEKNLCTDIYSILDVVTEETRIVFIANPNNPTGTCIAGSALQELRHALREDILLVIDSAYAEYVQWDAYDDGVSMVQNAIATGADNIVMTRTFSKMYGLGGLRLGWAYCPPAIIDVLNRIRGPFNVSSAAIAAGVAALADDDFIAENVRHNNTERARLFQAIAGLGFEVTPSLCNFLMVKMRNPSEALRSQEAENLLAFLEQRGIFIRGLKEYFLPGHVRISIGARESNDALLLALEEFVR